MWNQTLITDRIPEATEGYVFTLFVSSQERGGGMVGLEQERKG